MKKATRYFIYSFLLVLCMIVSISTFNVYAIDEVPTTKWTDYAASSFAGGDGSKNNPYQIATAEQLAKLAKEVNSGIPNETHSGEYFKLVAPIDLSGKIWVPIGYGNMNSHPFSGYFDGNNQTITGLYVDERGNNVCAGLFGVVVATSNETVLKKFKIENAKIYAGNNMNSENHPYIYGGGILVGELTIMGGSNVTFVGVENCHVTGSVDSKMYAGGLIGSASYAHVSNCSADVAIKGVSTSGGFVAYVFLSSFQDCMAKGDVQGGWNTGGFAGFISNDSTNNAEINHCVAYGNINANDWNAGGFVGSLESGRITNSLSYGDVTSTVTNWKPKVGGFAGLNTNGIIKDSIAAGKVTSLHSSIEPGGFIGYNDGSTENCAFDNIKNSLLNGIGEGNSTDSNGINA